ncbi:hypothetical protein TRIUR3_04119 [Triticum urartu]|uniref:Uncharacterized protein n=1 Tax=Triticum urartu TaxID=4572 RepID=M8A4G0_TRIUA|nr:hypothetical protein TRIUR3_04119 [Triticum urartu]
MGAEAALLLAVLHAALAYVLGVLRALVWVPRRLRRQGIRGPPRSLITGNGADYGALLAAAQSKPLASFHHAIVGHATLHYREWATRGSTSDLPNREL